MQKALIIVLEAEAMFIKDHQVVFERCFENTNEGQVVNRFSNEVRHYLWLQSLFNHLNGK